MHVHQHQRPRFEIVLLQLEACLIADVVHNVVALAMHRQTQKGTPTRQGLKLLTAGLLNSGAKGDNG